MLVRILKQTNVIVCSEKSCRRIIILTTRFVYPKTIVSHLYGKSSIANLKKDLVHYINFGVCYTIPQYGNIMSDNLNVG